MVSILLLLLLLSEAIHVKGRSAVQDVLQRNAFSIGSGSCRSCRQGRRLGAVAEWSWVMLLRAERTSLMVAVKVVVAHVVLVVAVLLLVWPSPPFVEHPLLLSHVMVVVVAHAPVEVIAAAPPSPHHTAAVPPAHVPGAEEAGTVGAAEHIIVTVQVVEVGAVAKCAETARG